MKLKNKKTGEIGYLLAGKTSCNYFVTNDEWDRCGVYNSLAELNEEWEDYEEPKEYWFINSVGEVIRPSDTDDWEQEDAAHHKQIGNYFETKEEAELAVRKLKAWRRLKDKGFRFEYYDYSDRDLHNHIQIKAITNREVEDSLLYKEDLDLLFSGGEE